MLEKIKAKKIHISLLLGFFLGLFIYYFIKPNTTKFQDIKVVEVVKVSRKDLSQTIKLTGKLRAKFSAMLSTKSPGILKILIQAGEKVIKDTIIAKIENPEIEKRYELSVKSENIALEQYKRAQNLVQSGAYSKADFENLQNKLLIAQKELADAKIAFDKLQIYAPFDGIIGVYQQKSGTQLKGTEVIVSFYDPTNLIVDFDVPAPSVPYVNNGQNLKINGQNYKLTHIQKALDEEKYMSPAFVNIECQDCIIGSNVDIELSTITKKSILVIPTEALFLRNNKENVYVVNDNKLNIKNIITGIRQKDEVEVISGLEENETIVAKATSRLYPGALVNIYRP